MTKHNYFFIEKNKFGHTHIYATESPKRLLELYKKEGYMQIDAVDFGLEGCLDDYPSPCFVLVRGEVITGF